jgi:pantetheine-phosphate adenylyltransferase
MPAKIALFPGSFDPITLGHTTLVQRSLSIFDAITVGIGQNNQKKYCFDLTERQNFIKKTFEKMPQVSVAVYEGLTMDFCKKIGATHIIRGLRSAPDFEYEKNIAQFNRLVLGVDTVFLVTDPALSHISSTIVRELLNYGADVRHFVPPCVADARVGYLP